jgi:hypothetical protein
MGRLVVVVVGGERPTEGERANVYTEASPMVGKTLHQRVKSVIQMRNFFPENKCSFACARWRSGRAPTMGAGGGRTEEIAGGENEARGPSPVLTPIRGAAEPQSRHSVPQRIVREWSGRTSRGVVTRTERSPRHSRRTRPSGRRQRSPPSMAPTRPTDSFPVPNARADPLASARGRSEQNYSRASTCFSSVLFLFAALFL